MNEYGLSINLKDNRKVFWEVVFSLLKNRRSNSFLVVSTAREYLLTKIEFLNFLILIIAKPEIVCIRNPDAWTFNKNNFGKEKMVYNLNSLFAIILRRALARRASLIVCESQSQIEFIKSKLGSKFKYISFPGRLSDVKPSFVKNFDILENKSRLKIGVLGSIDERKRDYRKLLQSINLIDQDSRPILVFLGSKLPFNSEAIIKRFDSVTQTFSSSEKRVSESEFYRLGEKCDVLIAPLREDFSYGANFGTGSVADGIALSKLIIFPKSIQIDKNLEGIFIRYESIDDLVNIFSRKSFQITSNFLGEEWNVGSLRKKLELNSISFY
jgi:hypothetical protein